MYSSSRNKIYNPKSYLSMERQILHQLQNFCTIANLTATRHILIFGQSASGVYCVEHQTGVSFSITCVVSHFCVCVSTLVCPGHCPLSPITILEGPCPRPNDACMVWLKAYQYPLCSTYSGSKEKLKADVAGLSGKWLGSSQTRHARWSRRVYIEDGAPFTTSCCLGGIYSENGGVRRS